MALLVTKGYWYHFKIQNRSLVNYLLIIRKFFLPIQDYKISCL